MSEQKNPTPQAADESALSDESLESVAGGRSLTPSEPEILLPPTLVMPVEPVVEPLPGDLDQLVV
jgi:hypothetical protein